MTLGPCPGLANRCPRHKTAALTLTGPWLAAPQGGIGNVFDMGMPPSHITQTTERIQMLSPVGKLVFRRPGLGWGQKGAKRRGTPGHCCHPNSGTPEPTCPGSPAPSAYSMSAPHKLALLWRLPPARSRLPAYTQPAPRPPLPPSTLTAYRCLSYSSYLHKTLQPDHQLALHEATGLVETSRQTSIQDSGSQPLGRDPLGGRATFTPGSPGTFTKHRPLTL